MDAERAALAAQHAELALLVDGLDDGRLARPSRCPGWSVSDVLLHLAQTDEMALASVEGRFGQHLDSIASHWDGATSVDDGAGRMVENERDGLTGTEARERWTLGAARLREAIAGRDGRDRVQWVVGEMALRTLMATRMTECWIHTVDIADGLGVVVPPTERLELVVRLAWRTLPYALSGAGITPSGPIAFHLTSPRGDEWRFDPDEPAVTIVRGTAADLCAVAGQRATASDTALTAEGPDAEAVLRLVRTFA